MKKKSFLTFLFGALCGAVGGVIGGIVLGSYWADAEWEDYLASIEEDEEYEDDEEYDEEIGDELEAKYKKKVSAVCSNCTR